MNTIRNMYATYFVTVGFMLLFAQSRAEDVRMYSQKYFQGTSFNITMDYNTSDQCTNLPLEWQNNVSSVNTANLCLEMFAEMNCDGKNIVIYPETTSHFDLSYWKFDKKTKSAKTCTEQLHHSLNNTITILFNRGYYTGYANINEFNLNVRKCENIPKDYKIMRIDEYNTCFEYYDTENCQGTILEYNKNSTTETIFEQPGLEKIRSVRRCTEGGKRTGRAAEITTNSGKKTTSNFICILSCIAVGSILLILLAVLGVALVWIYRYQELTVYTARLFSHRKRESHSADVYNLSR